MKENSLPPVQQNVLVTLANLYPHDRNYRQHPPEQIKQLKASLERFGQVRSIVAQECSNGTYTIVAGHGVVEARVSAYLAGVQEDDLIYHGEEEGIDPDCLPDTFYELAEAVQ